MSASIDERLNSDKTFWTMVSGPSSVFFSDLYLARMTPRDTILLVDTIEALLHFSIGKSKAVGNEGKPSLYGLIVRLLTHSDYQVRRATFSMLSKVQPVMPSITDGLIAAFAAYLQAVSCIIWIHTKLYFSWHNN